MAEETAKGSVESVELTRAQQNAARRVAESRATIPHLYVVADATVGDALRTLEPSLVRAAALALGEWPDLNGAYRDGRIERHSRVNVGVAVAAQGTVLHPTIFDADRKQREAVEAELSELAARARDGAITQPELSGATFTVSTLGAPGARRVLATIVPGQAAILSAAAVRDGTAELVLGCDERIVGADVAGKFLARVGALLGRPSDL